MLPSEAAVAAARASTAEDMIDINRAPVLTLWASVVAEREGYTSESALTFGKYIAGGGCCSKDRVSALYSGIHSDFLLPEA